MISLIICSRTSDIDAALKENIQNTIGVDYELVVIDNSNNDHSIFSAYNEGIKRAKGDILCFMHDDILYRSNDWGNKVVCLLSDKSIGMIGLAGSHFFPKAPMYWWSSPFISQYNIENDNGVLKTNETVDYFVGDLSEVVAVDGLCFFIPAKMFNTIRFDEKTFSGFHGYDMDISFQVQNAGKRVCVTRSVSVEHRWSETSFGNASYMAQLDNNITILFEKWKEMLPITRGIDLPEIVVERLNNLCIQAYDAKKVRKSKAYRLGRLLLLPFKKLKHLT